MLMSKKISIEITMEVADRKSAEQLSGYVLRALGGVAANNRAVVTGYSSHIEKGEDDTSE